MVAVVVAVAVVVGDKRGLVRSSEGAAGWRVCGESLPFGDPAGWVGVLLRGKKVCSMATSGCRLLLVINASFFSGRVADKLPGRELCVAKATTERYQLRGQAAGAVRRADRIGAGKKDKREEG